MESKQIQEKLHTAATNWVLAEKENRGAIIITRDGDQAAVSVAGFGKTLVVGLTSTLSNNEELSKVLSKATALMALSSLSKLKEALEAND